MSTEDGHTRPSRRLAAILAADIAGYSALMGADEARTVQDLKGHQAVVLPMIGRFGGRIIDTAGDGILAEFNSVANAVECAVAIQDTMRARNAETEAHRIMQYRIGINLGDVIYDESRIYGDGINIAARLESLAKPGGICISSKVYEDVRGKIDLIYEDMGEQQLKNIAQSVRSYRARSVSQTPLLTTTGAATVAEKPSVAVLPFTNMSGDPTQEYFSDGITEDIITEVSRFSQLFVIARNSSFQYKGRSFDVRQVGRELGVRYVLEGSTRHVGDRVRITAQLINAETGAHRWAERYDRQIEDVFAVQDEVACAIATLLVAHVNKAEVERILLKPPATWQAYDYFMQAGALVASWRAVPKGGEALDEARQLLKLSLSHDPKFARAFALLSDTYYLSYVLPSDASYLHLGTLDQALELAKKAVQFDPNLPEAHALLASILTWKRQHTAALLAAERAITLNSNNLPSLLVPTILFAGEYRRTIELGAKIMKRDPMGLAARHLPGWVGLAYYMLGQYNDAIPHLRECASRSPDYRAVHVWLAATYVRLGQLREAQAEASEVLRIEPTYTIDGTQKILSVYKREEDAEHLLQALREAGLPEK